jgi:hypothetical protein
VRVAFCTIKHAPKKGMCASYFFPVRKFEIRLTAVNLLGSGPKDFESLGRRFSDSRSGKHLEVLPLKLDSRSEDTGFIEQKREENV